MNANLVQAMNWKIEQLAYQKVKELGCTIVQDRITDLNGVSVKQIRNAYQEAANEVNQELKTRWSK